MDPSTHSRCSLGRDDRVGPRLARTRDERVGATSLARNDVGGLAGDEPLKRRRRDIYIAWGVSPRVLRDQSTNEPPKGATDCPPAVSAPGAPRSLGAVHLVKYASPQRHRITEMITEDFQMWRWVIGGSHSPASRWVPERHTIINSLWCSLCPLCLRG